MLTCDLLSDKLPGSNLQLHTKSQSLIRKHQEKNPPEPVRPEEEGAVPSETLAMGRM